jgi:hypothetical protein
MVEPSNPGAGSKQPDSPSMSKFEESRDNPLSYEQFKIDSRLSERAKNRLKHPKLHPLIA